MKRKHRMNGCGDDSKTEPTRTDIPGQLDLGGVPIDVPAKSVDKPVVDHSPILPRHRQYTLSDKGEWMHSKETFPRAIRSVRWRARENRPRKSCLDLGAENDTYGPHP